MKKLLFCFCAVWIALNAGGLCAHAAETENAAQPPASALLAHAQNVLESGAGYIYGASGQTSTADFRHGRMQLYPEHEQLIRRWGEAWDGLPVYDCIGLLKAFAREREVASIRVDVNTTGAWETWVSDWGVLEGAALTPGMVLFRIEGSRMLVKHVGVYMGSGRVIHARGTRWGVVEDELPNVFTHWAQLHWITYDLPPETVPAVDGVFLPPGTLAVVESPDGDRVVGTTIPQEAGKLREPSAYYPDGAILLVLEAPDEMSRQVIGDDVRGNTVTAYVRLTELRDAQDWD